MKNKQILAIIGCGWLGRQFIAHAQNDYALLASSHAKDLPIPTYPYRWQNEPLPPALCHADLYLIALPPNAGEKAHYPVNMQRLIRQLPQTARVLMVSSTGVYPQAPGNYDEYSPILDDHPISLAEQALREHPKATIVRSAGQYGAGRIPLSKNNSLPDKRLNLISGNNLCRALLALLHHPQTAGKTYNLVEPEHPWRSIFAARFVRNPPAFIGDNSPSRLIDGKRISRDIGFTYLSYL